MKIQVKKKSAGVTMFAMPDIAFLLLIFLILTVSVDEQGDIELPDFRFIQETDFTDTLVVNVTRDGQFGISGENMPESQLSAVLDRVPDSTVINLVADRECRYSYVDHILDMLQSKGLLDVVLIMEDDPVSHE